MVKQPLIYIVDDDQVLCKNTATFLENHSFETQSFYEIESLEYALHEKKCDLILLDIMLPGESGFDFIRRIRAEAMKIIFISALGEEADLILGLELGAEDYIIKPFSPRELLARIRVVLRRQIQTMQEKDIVCYHFCGWKLETVSRLLVSPDHVIRKLSGAEYRLLKYFLEHPRQIIERETLFSIINRADRQVHEQTLDTQISRLRICLGESAKDQCLLRTSRGDGYFLAADVEKTYGFN